MSVWLKGCGLVSSAGLGFGCHISKLHSGDDCLSGHTENGIAQLDGEVINSLSALRSERRSYKRLDESVLLAILASRDLLSQVSVLDKEACVIFGSSRGAANALEEYIKQFNKGDRLPAYTSPVTTANTLPSTIAKEFDLSGFHFSVSAACATGLHAVGIASAMVKSGQVSNALAGVSEFSDTPFVREILRRTKVLQSGEYNGFPHRSMSSDRSGMVLSSGASCVLLSSSSESASAELIGYGGSSEDVGLTSISKDGRGIKIAIQRALKQANVQMQDIDFIVGHGSSTVKGDEAELAALDSLFLEFNTPYIYHKWLTGHMLSVSSMASLGLACEHLRTGDLPFLPYLCRDHYLNKRIFGKRNKKLKYAVVISMGFGGNSAALVLKSMD